MEKINESQPPKKPSLKCSETNQKNKVQGAALEKTASILTDTELTPGSGCGIIFKGDLQHTNWLLEVKSTRARQFVFNLAWVTKAQKQANDKGKENWAVIFGWNERPDKYTGSLRFVAIPSEFDLKKIAILNIKGKTKTLPHSFLTQIVDDVSCVVSTSSTEPFQIVTLNTFTSKCLAQ